MSDTLVINEIYLSLQGESTFAGLPCIFVRLTACNLRCSYCDSAYAFKEGTRMPLANVRAEVHRLAHPFSRIPQNTLGTESDCRGRREESCRASATSKETPHVVSYNSSEISGPERAPSPLSSVLRPLSSTLPLVELTGGEPLLQKASLPLMQGFCDDGFTVLLETSGAHDIGPVDPRVHRIMDLKCPSSGEVARNRWENLPLLKATDEIKFVIGTIEDYEWAKAAIADHGLKTVCPLLFSWVHPLAPEQRDESLKTVPTGLTPISQQELVERIIADSLPVRFQVQLHKLIWPAEKRGV
jgi:7-carboxy-7-deazaguanine synthase